MSDELVRRLRDPRLDRANFADQAAARITELEAQVLYFEAERDRWFLGELLAVIHRDGGHHLAENGPEASVAVAVAAWCDLQMLAAAERETTARLREALTPSGDTKAAYMGEFHFQQIVLDEDDEEVSVKTPVPWDTVKEIMAAIRARAALAAVQAQEGEE